MDEATADDGAIHSFWRFIAAVRADRRAVDFDPHRLERVGDFARAVAAFDALEVDP